MFSAGSSRLFVTRWFGANSSIPSTYGSRRVWPGDTLPAEGRVVRVFDAMADGAQLN